MKIADQLVAAYVPREEEQLEEKNIDKELLRLIKKNPLIQYANFLDTIYNMARKEVLTWRKNN